MNRAIALPLGIVAFAVAATIQFATDGALGMAAASPSVPRLVAVTFGDAPARALGIAPRVRAIDASGESAEIERRDAAGDYRNARALQRALVSRLREERANPEVLSGALWRLGQLDAEAGYREPPARQIEWKRALEDYREALEALPLSETVLLAAGNQTLANGARSEAIDYFRRAVASDPSSDAAHRGLHRALTGEGVPPPYVAPAEWIERKR